MHDDVSSGAGSVAARTVARTEARTAASAIGLPLRHERLQAFGLGLAALGGAGAYAAGLEAALPQQASAVVLFTVFLAATLSSIAGFAFSLICGAALVHMLDTPLDMVATLLVASIGIQCFCTWTLRRDLDWRGALPFLVGGAATLPFGQLILLRMPGHVYAATLGGLLVAYALWTLFRPPLGTVQGSTARDVLVGAAGGITGGLVATPSVPVIIWLGLQGWPRARQRNVVQPYILAMQVAAMLTIRLLAPEREAALFADPALLTVLPPALLGAACGIWIYDRLSDRQFTRVVTLLLLAAGMALIALSAGRPA